MLNQFILTTFLSGACYTKTAGNLHTETTADDVEEEEEDVIIDIDGKDTEKGLWYKMI